MDEKLVDRVLELAVEIQQIPAPTFGEHARGEFVRGGFLEAGLRDVAADEQGNVFGCLPGQNNASPLVVSAHLDTVFPAGTDLSFRREAGKIYGPGLGDNALGVAGLFGLLWTLRQQGQLLPGDLWLVANVEEEGLGDSRGMCRVVDRFGEGVVAYLVLEGMALGQIYHRGLGVQRYRIAVDTPGGHSWVDYGRPSAIHELAELINQISKMGIPAKPRSSMNVGLISGGTSINTIAASASMELDLRSESVTILGSLCRQVESLTLSRNRQDVNYSYEIIGQRPVGRIPVTHPLVRLAQRCLTDLGIQPKLQIGSTDANIPLSRGLPALCLGLTTGGGAHSAAEYILTEPLRKGLSQLVAFVKGAYLIQTGMGWKG